MISWIIDQKSQVTIQEFLRKKQSMSRRILNALKFEGGAILVNGIAQKANYQLIKGDLLEVYFPPESRSPLMVPEDIPITIVYEDRDIIIINKQPDIAVTPSPLNPSSTIANGLINYYNEKDLSYTVHTVTRLDRNTSGLLLIAKHRYSHSLLFNDQQAQKINRGYYALVENTLTNQQGTIKLPIARKENSIIERTVSEHGREAITHYQVKATTPAHTLISVKLETGRTHQIRVHFSYIGNPLAGDDLYGGSLQYIKRQALHCNQLNFNHPLTKRKMMFTLPLPEDMKQLLK